MENQRRRIEDEAAERQSDATTKETLSEIEKSENLKGKKTGTDVIAPDNQPADNDDEADPAGPM